MLLTSTKIFLQGTECSELQEQLKDREKVLIEKDTVLKEKTLKLKQVRTIVLCSLPPNHRQV